LAAIGPLAEELIAKQSPLDVYAPFRSLLAHHGTVIMIGVGLTRMTLIHYAEQQAGRTLFRRWANSSEGQIIEMEVGSCSEGFGNFDSIFAPFERRVTVEMSLWRIFDAASVVSEAMEAIQANPHITHCIEENCERCNDAVMGGPLLKSTH
jgi:aminoglycoside 3-N-acetyltransferase